MKQEQSPAATSQSELPFSFKAFDVEMFFAKRLREHRRPIFEGSTDRVMRRERIREAIIDGGLDAVIVGRAPGGKPETYSQSFARFYGEPLQSRKKTA